MDWDERYGEPGFAYGTAPNDFLVSVVDRIPKGKILSLAEGEGRIRIPLHQATVRGLKPGGVFVLEAFSKEQLGYGTGGPQSLDMLMSLNELNQELAGLEFVHAVQIEREVREGSGHTGLASVVQLLGIK